MSGPGPSELRKRECISSSLAVVLGRCLVVWLVQHESALYAHVVHSSLITVLAVV